MDEMTGPGEDSHKHKSDDAAKYLAESFFGLNMNPADVGGEVLFDDYDDNKSAIQTGSASPQRSADGAASFEAFSSADAGSSSVTSAPNRFEENLDDLIVFSDDDDDDDDVVVDDEDEEDDDENFDFGDEDDEEEEEEEDDDEEDFDDEDDDEEEEDELDDAELDFGDDVIVPAPKKTVPAARASGPARDERGVDSRSNPSRSGRASAESREEQRPSSGHRGDRRDERPAARDNRPAARGGRPQETRTTRADSRGPDRLPAAKAADAGRKSPSADDEHWNELEGWVWDDDAKKKPAASSASRPIAADIADDDDDDDDEIVEAAPAAPATRVESEDAAPRRRGRRRGGRGRGRGRRDEIETAAPAGDAAASTGQTVDFDDDFSEIMFEEDQEDFVSVSAGSVKAQRRIQDEPQSPAARKTEPDDSDDEDEEGEDVERSADGESGPDRPRRGRRGRRGRGGRGREDSREPVRAEERPAASARRPARDEDNMDDDDDDLEVDDVDLTDFGDLDDDEELPRRREGTRSEPARTEPVRSERPPRSGQGRGRGRSQQDREPQDPESTEGPRRQPARDSRPSRESQPARDAQPAREPRPARDSQPEREPRPAREPRPEREARPTREPRPASASNEGDSRRGPRPPIVAAEFQDIPTWEEAIGSLAIRTPSEEHARRAESRGRRDGGGRPPRRKN